VRPGVVIVVVDTGDLSAALAASGVELFL